ncbi:cation transporter [Flavobacterium sp. CYK-55]|uniref:heavy-metal-associated domain-containing protein n=1 Tax=Flavobacterium sp. CYK-55 TaxID=2835529 RepID=UPI001BCA8959|nr:heavy-metal-associated domain-containing protein [Flavobacterium sp. CYK-55]MBS7785772.1 cation transporter [Flavobacterium sp. CYK-55]
MKTLLMTFCLMLTLTGVQAQIKNKNAQYTIEVNGNCETCKKRIEKAALSVSGVKSASWDMNTHELTLIINEEKTTLFAVKKAIAAVGHDSEEVKAEDSVYENLHSCCKYERQ